MNCDVIYFYDCARVRSCQAYVLPCFVVMLPWDSRLKPFLCISISLSLSMLDSSDHELLLLLFFHFNKVWAIADTKRQGFLGFKEFITAMQVPTVFVFVYLSANVIVTMILISLSNFLYS